MRDEAKYARRDRDWLSAQVDAEASRGTWLLGSGACEASHVAMPEARSRSVPVARVTAKPKIALALATHRRKDDHCWGEVGSLVVHAITTPLAISVGLNAQRDRSAKPG